MTTVEAPATASTSTITSAPSSSGSATITSQLSPVETKPIIIEPKNCFVCDVLVTTPKHCTLATSRTHSTNIRLIEKLGQMVGEQYMVVICEDDVICRCCTSLINTLDRLETEMSSVRSAVLRFLEKKYSLEEGELVNNRTTGVGIPPQITSRDANGFSENIMFNKRRNALADDENDENVSDLNKGKKGSKNDVWMQCDKCKYTTRYHAFLLHHVRQHIKKTMKCDFCNEEVKEGSYCIKKCIRKENPDKVVLERVDHQTPQVAVTPRGSMKVTKPQGHSTVEAETVEMIAAEINDMDIKPIPHLHEPSRRLCEARSQSVHNQTGTMMRRNEEFIIPVTDMSKEQIQQQIAAGNLEMQMENPEGSTPTAICVMEMSEEPTPDEPTLLTVQKMEGDENDAVYVQVVEVGKEDEGSGVPKVLTLSDDGTVEMVEVMWDDVVASQVTGENMDFN